jgi:archaellum component FlaC
VQKINGFIACCCFILIGILGGYYAGRSSRDNSEYETRLGFIVKVNRELQEENRRIKDINSAISKRLGDAESIIDGLGKQAQGDGEAIQRIRSGLSILESFAENVGNDK